MDSQISIIFFTKYLKKKRKKIFAKKKKIFEIV